MKSGIFFVLVIFSLTAQTTRTAIISRSLQSAHSKMKVKTSNAKLFPHPSYFAAVSAACSCGSTYIRRIHIFLGWTWLCLHDTTKSRPRWEIIRNKSILSVCTQCACTFSFCVSAVCLLDQSSCGCCLIRKQTQRMEWLFNVTYGEMKKELTQTKTILNDMRGEQHNPDGAEYHQSVSKNSTNPCLLLCISSQPQCLLCCS